MSGRCREWPLVGSMDAEESIEDVADVSVRWQPGETVVWRSRPQGNVGYVIPMTVVVDEPRCTVLFQATGSVCKKRSGRRGGPGGRTMVSDGWDGRHDDVVFPGPPTLRLHPWGAAHAVIRSWNFTADRAEGWYVNLESPWRRTRIGFDSQDLVLDVTAAHDLSSWAWKDSDELDWSVEVSKYSREEAEEIREEGLRVVKRLEQRAWPFHEDWSAWRPNASWPVPGVPENWNDATL